MIGWGKYNTSFAPLSDDDTPEQKLWKEKHNAEQMKGLIWQIEKPKREWGTEYDFKLDRWVHTNGYDCSNNFYHMYFCPCWEWGFNNHKRDQNSKVWQSKVPLGPERMVT